MTTFAFRELRRFGKFLRETERALRIRSAGNASGPYWFSTYDALLHARERSWQLPPMSVREDGMFRILGIEGSKVWWPSDFESRDVPWLWMECSIPARRNPSSYDATRVPYSNFDWVLDLGACEGLFSLRALGLGARRVIAVEPVVELAGALNRTLAEAIGEGRASVVHAAVGRSCGVTSMRVLGDRPCESSASSRPLDEGPVGKSFVELVSLDSLAVREEVAGPGLVKMDIEGGEMDALAGARELIRRSRPVLAIAVYHGLDNAMECRKLVLEADPAYDVWFRGMWAWDGPPRPHMMFACPRG